MNTNKEIVTIVDRDNRVIRSAPRDEMRRKTLIHRASYILVFNKAGELFLQKRTQSKDIYPGYYDIAAGGVVLADESYEESAKRELQEELGIADVPLEFLFDHYYSDKNNKVWGRIFRCVHEGPFLLQEEEVESGEFVPFAELIAQRQTKHLTPDGIEILEKM